MRQSFFETVLIERGLSAAAAKIFTASFAPVEFEKRQAITKEGQTENYLYFVLEGIQRSVFVWNGKEHVVAFTYPGQTTGVPDSFVTRQSSKCTLETLTATKLLRIHHDNFRKQLNENHELALFFLKGYEMLAAGTVTRQYELQDYSMQERFQVFYNRSKHLINQIPRKDIASYLNIDPTNLSKLMAKMK